MLYFFRRILSISEWTLSRFTALFLIPIAFLNTVITLAPLLRYTLRRTVESNTNDLKKKNIITSSHNVLLVYNC